MWIPVKNIELSDIYRYGFYFLFQFAKEKDYIEATSYNNPCAYFYGNKKRQALERKKLAITKKIDTLVYYNNSWKDAVRINLQYHKNVISALYKIIIVSDGTIGGSIHVGCANAPTEYYFNKDCKVVHFFSPYGRIEERDRYCYRLPAYFGTNDNIFLERGCVGWPDNFIQDFLSKKLLPNIGANPYAANLNAGKDVKISNEQAVTQSNGVSDSSSSIYYGYYSSYGNGRSQNSQTTVTTQIDAQYIRCSDFYEVYRPLSKLFADELQKYMKQ